MAVGYSNCDYELTSPDACQAVQETTSRGSSAKPDALTARAALGGGRADLRVVPHRVRPCDERGNHLGRRRAYHQPGSAVVRRALSHLVRRRRNTAVLSPALQRVLARASTLGRL